MSADHARDSDAALHGAEAPDSLDVDQSRTVAPAAATGGAWGRFKAWRAGRPFIPGLLLILSGIVIAMPAYFTVQISDLLVMISTVSGVSTLLIGALLVMFGLGAWFRPTTATYLGVLGIIVAVIALPTSNLGGFLIGSLLGIVGGALTLAWEPSDG